MEYNDLDIQEKLYHVIDINTPAVEEKPGDFRDENGILHCGVCGEQKSLYPPALMHGRREVTCGCKCDRQRDTLEKHAQRIRDVDAQVRELYNMGVADIPRHRFESIHPNDLKNDETAHKLMRYVANFPEMKQGNHGLILHGGHGTGKTFYLECLAHTLIYDQGQFAWLTNLDELTDAYNDKSKQDTIRRWIRNADLLMIDDYTMDRATERIKYSYRI